MRTNTLKKILDKNPKANRDKETIRTALSHIQKLREYGIEPHGYSLVHPFKRINRDKPEIILTPATDEA